MGASNIPVRLQGTGADRCGNELIDVHGSETVTLVSGLALQENTGSPGCWRENYTTGHSPESGRCMPRIAVPQTTLPGFMMPCGSSADLTLRIKAISTGDL